MGRVSSIGELAAKHGVKRFPVEPAQPVGRGRAIVGDRAEWSEAEVAVLRRAVARGSVYASLPLKRSYQAIRNKLHRLRRAGML